MPQTTLETIESLLRSALNETDDSEIRFKIRQALQLLTLFEGELEDAGAALSDADIGEEVRENLRELGYLE